METTHSLKIYMLPFFAQGHMIPLVNLARLLASQNQHVTIITTPSNANLFEKTIQQDNSNGHKITIHIINFPSKQLNLPPGVENLFAATDNDTAYKIAMAAHLIKPEIESFLKNNPPDVLIPDIMFTWTENTAKNFQIPRLVFNPISIFDVCMIEAIKRNPDSFASDLGPYNIPGLPHKLTLPIKPSPGFARVTEPLIEAESGSHGVIVNSFAELDVGYTEHYENLTGRKVWHVGPTSLMVEKCLEKKVSSDEVVVGSGPKHECLTWLDTKQPGSVVYICFGSLCRLSDEQFYEIAVGLEASNHQFLWVVHRKNDNSKGEISGGAHYGGVENGVAHSGGVENGGVQNGGAHSGGVENGGVQNGVAHSGGVENGRVQNGVAHSGGVENGGDQNGGAHSGGVENGGVQNGGAHSGGVENGGVQNGGTHKFLPEGFEERMTKEKRGMLIKGWAPQQLILNHPSIGGFLTHCGWNAVVEAISAGVPMITMPGFGDQYYNEKLVTEVHCFGVEVGAAEWSISPYDAKKSVVNRERIEKAVKSLMDEEGKEIREKAKVMKEKAWKAVQKGGSSYNCLTEIVDYLESVVVVPKSSN